MNLLGLILFLIIQIVVNQLLLNIFPVFTANMVGVLAYCLISSLIISFFGAFLATPRGYKKDFYKQPGFHKLMLFYYLFCFRYFNVFCNLKWT